MKELCQKCGCTLKPGDLRYGVKIELISLFDGYLEEPKGDIDEEIERLIQNLSQQDPDEAARDVAQTIYLVICRSCRNGLIKEWDLKRQAH
ncbi:MAG: hypothetical protein JRI34_07525 [Deltaproteobacteria bacterium]|nr:hypothetical protein [Deltaproteobacteria bacterium]